MPKAVPSPSRLATSMLPPIASMSCRLSVSPIPLPSVSSPRPSRSKGMNTRDLFGCDAVAVVRDFDADQAFRTASPTDLHLACLVVELDAVGDDVDQDLDEPLAISGDTERFAVA